MFGEIKGPEIVPQEEDEDAYKAEGDGAIYDEDECSDSKEECNSDGEEGGCGDEDEGW